MLDVFQKFCVVLSVVLTVFFGYQFIYLIVGLISKPHRQKRLPEKRLHRYAAIVSARNEENVIGELLDSLRGQDYPPELLDLYVVADNCTDGTAGATLAHGARVYERFDSQLVGKGYALDWLFGRMREDGLDKLYDGYFVLDADNIVHPGFVREMNRMFDTGKYTAITSYRNSKNYASNWISAGYSLWFIREARLLNYPRQRLNTGCSVSGTGFLMSAEIVRENGGWPFHLLTEDMEFSVDCTVKGKRIGYCHEAMIYDEQPTGLAQAWNQRLRWSKGFVQVFFRYLGRMLKGCFACKGGRFACFDLMMFISPAVVLAASAVALALFAAAAAITQPKLIAVMVCKQILMFLLGNAASYCGGMFLYGVIVMAAEWRQVEAPAVWKVVYLFTFPLYMLTYVPIAVVSIVSKVEWKPIRHNTVASLKKKRQPAARAGKRLTERNQAKIGKI